MSFPADFAGDPSKSRFRQLDIFMVESGGDRFRQRLASFRGTHFGLPPDWHLQIDRSPKLWLGHVTVPMLQALPPFPPAA